MISASSNRLKTPFTIKTSEIELEKYSIVIRVPQLCILEHMALFGNKKRQILMISHLAVKICFISVSIYSRFRKKQQGSPLCVGVKIKILFSNLPESPLAKDIVSTAKLSPKVSSKTRYCATLRIFYFDLKKCDFSLKKGP